MKPGPSVVTITAGLTISNMQSMIWSKANLTLWLAMISTELNIRIARLIYHLTAMNIVTEFIQAFQHIKQTEEIIAAKCA